jgi:hypothetical protein
MPPDTLTGAGNPEGTQPGDAPNAGTGKSYSQADLDRLVGERLNREKSKTTKQVEQARAEAVQAWREENGLDDDALELWKKRDESQSAARAQKSQLTKAQNEAESWKKKHDNVFSKLDSTLRSEAILRAATGKSHAPQDVVLHLLPRVKVLEDFSIAVVDDKGEPSGKDIETAVADLLEQKPYLALPTGNHNGVGSHGSETPIPASAGKELWRTPAGRVAILKKSVGEK